MEYIISEEELIEFDKRPFDVSTSYEQDVKQFLKSKQPIDREINNFRP